jgi:hypothetical protein
MRNALHDQASVDQQAVAHTFTAVVTERLNAMRGLVVAIASAPAIRTPLLTDQVQPEVNGVPGDADTECRATLHAAADAGGGAFTSLAFWAPNGDEYMFERQKAQTKQNYSDGSS